MLSISVLFAAVLSGCTDKDSDDTSDTTDTDTPTTDLVSYELVCENAEGYCSEINTTVSLGSMEFESYLDANNQLTEESCVNICIDQSVPAEYNICSCRYDGQNDVGGYDITCLTAECAVEGRGHGEVQKAQVTTGPTDLACWFARAFHAEASSVVAFLQLRAELQAHGAPTQLLERCMTAAKEEVLHARQMSKFCFQEQGKAPPLSFGAIPNRSLYELALDNAVEGCIFETYSALKAHYQAANAGDLQVRQLMRIVATDETNHAQLAWDVHNWLMRKLTPQQRASIVQAQRQALRQLRQQKPSSVSEESAFALGLPGTELVEQFALQLAI